MICNRKHTSLALVTALVFTWASAAQAQAPKPPERGAETNALQVFVGAKKKAGKKMPPMMKPVDSEGTMSCAWTGGELWLACDIDEKITGGPIKRFRAHMTMGWDFRDKAYRAYIATDQGSAIPMNGWRQGDNLIFQSQEIDSPLGKMKLRWTFNLKDSKAIGFHDERSIGGMPWFTFEKTTIR
jgi:hypothetical protein